MELIEKCENYVRKVFERQLPEGMSFHNIEHTYRVVKAIEIIIDDLNINDWDRETVLVAGWFHDIGYCYTYEGHEAISMTLAGDFLRDEIYSDRFIKGVNECIRATKIPQAPSTWLEGVICDADMYHLALPWYPKYAAQLRSEWAQQLDKFYSDKEWQELNLAHMSGHHFFTEFAIKNWSQGKEKNVEEIRRSLQNH